jgi:dTDP-glucose 4,6-dehydratase
MGSRPSRKHRSGEEPAWNGAPPLRHVLVTGGAGFIGSALCRFLLGKGGYRVINVDKLTYAGNLPSLDPIRGHPNYRFEQVDIADAQAISDLLQTESVDGVIHLAAETHVDRSIKAPAEFIETNIVGTFRLLQVVAEHWRRLEDPARRLFRFHHVSTDEVFGDVAHQEKQAKSEVRYQPSSPYSASKAAAEHLVNAWHRTYGLPILISHSSNNYGPNQYPDKLIPVVLINALEERPIPIYGTGANLRDWLYIDDHVRALECVFRNGRVGESYGIGARAVRTNLEVVRAVCRLLDEMRMPNRGRPHEELIAFVADRPGHDQRYAVDPVKTERDLKWSPVESFETGLRKTVAWYLTNTDWWRPLANSIAAT